MLLAGLALRRFQRLAVNPQTPLRAHMKLAQLLALVLLGDLLWGSLCVLLFMEAGASLLALLLYDCVMVAINVCYTLAKMGLHVRDLSHNGLWERRGKLEVYTELLVDVSNLVLTLAHYAHIWSLHGISMTLIDGIILMNIKATVDKLKRKVAMYRTYLRVAREMSDRFPVATAEECAAAGGTCAICLQDLEEARRLPCNHVFHFQCLRQWLQRVEANDTCPMCRQPTTAAPPATAAAPAAAAAAAAAPDGAREGDGDGGGVGDGTGGAAAGAAADGAPAATGLAPGTVGAVPVVGAPVARNDPVAAAVTAAVRAAARPGATPAASTASLVPNASVDFGHETLFTLNAAGWGGWLPRVSMQVARGGGQRGGGGGLFDFLRSPLSEERLEEMTRQVLDVFPHLSPNAVRRDLGATRSVELSIERALAGRILAAVD